MHSKMFRFICDDCGYGSHALQDLNVHKARGCDNVRKKPFEERLDHLFTQKQYKFDHGTRFTLPAINGSEAKSRQFDFIVWRQDCVQIVECDEGFGGHRLGSMKSEIEYARTSFLKRKRNEIDHADRSPSERSLNDYEQKKYTNDENNEYNDECNADETYECEDDVNDNEDEEEKECEEINECAYDDDNDNQDEPEENDGEEKEREDDEDAEEDDEDAFPTDCERNPYNISCEQSRLFDLVTYLRSVANVTLPIGVIRYNPDRFKVDGVRQPDISQEVREAH